MGIMRGLANIVTLGAFGRVDRAKDSYDSVVFYYNYYKEKAEETLKNYKEGVVAVQIAKKALKRNRKLLKKLSRNKKK